MFAAVHESGYGTKETCADDARRSAHGSNPDIDPIPPKVLVRPGAEVSRSRRSIARSRGCGTAPTHAGDVGGGRRHGHGVPRRLGAVGAPMSIDTIAVPKPGSTDVLVEVRACGMVPNLGNVLANWTRWFPHLPLPRLPAIFGLDPAGIVIEVGHQGAALMV